MEMKNCRYCQLQQFFLLSQQRPYACQLPGCEKRYTDPSSLRKHVKNHDVKGRRKSHKEQSGNKLSANKLRRRFSESSVASATSCEPATPSTPIITSSKFDFDDVFDDPQPSSHCAANSPNSLNLDEMSNCLITLMDHSTINGDNVVSSPENIGNGYKQGDNNYDSIINYCDQNDFGIVYFSQLSLFFVPPRRFYDKTGPVKISIKLLYSPDR